MRASRGALWWMALLLCAMFALPAASLAQESEPSDQSYRFSREELTQMLAPIALYPDALTAQILMASTYPLEVVQAERWCRQNPELSGDELDTALQDQPWDPSVKALCHFPDLLASMSDKLDQTRKLGDAFLGQEQEVMDVIQELRRKAHQQGNLKSTGEQKVIVEPQVIKIEPVNPQVIYLPVYDPFYVYGPWWYPAYPPYYWYYPPGFRTGAVVSFGPRFHLGYNLFSWVWFDWGVRRVHIDIDRTRHFHRPIVRRAPPGPVWRHDPMHRRGVAYRDPGTSRRFGSRTPQITPRNPERRGYPQHPGVHSPQASPHGERSQPHLHQPRKVRPTQPVVHDTPFRGIGEGGFERRAAERGRSSTRSVEAPARKAIPSGKTPVQPPASFAPRGGQFQRPAHGATGGSGHQQSPSIGRHGGGAHK